MSVAYLGNQYITFTELGNNFVIPQHAYIPPLDIDYLIVGAGGAGSGGPYPPEAPYIGGGGGAGGFLSGSMQIEYGIAYQMIVGTGSLFSNGQNTNGLQLTALGGGLGQLISAPSGSNGGSGGGGAGGGVPLPTHLAGTGSQGFNGGVGGNFSGAGGGGASSAGINGDGTLIGGAGGAGTYWLDGTPYAGGGGGAGGGAGTGNGGAGGIGGGGNGGQQGLDGVSGSANTGGGGGAAGANANGGQGGSGIIKFRYLSNSALCIGGDITQSGGYIYHTFTSGSSTLVYTGIPTPVTTTTTTTPAPTTTTTTTAAPTTTTTCTGTSVGCYYQGGIVVYNSGGTILVAATSDLGQIEWGCGDVDIPGANGTAIGTGESNTAAIVAAGCGGAAAACQGLTLNGYSDWYLPSIDELVVMRASRTVLGMTGEYWSSTQTCGFSSRYYASSLVMSTGSNPCGYRPFSLRVRPLRQV